MLQLNVNSSVLLTLDIYLFLFPNLFMSRVMQCFANPALLARVVWGGVPTASRALLANLSDPLPADSVLVSWNVF